MEVIGAVASVTTLVALAKEIAGITGEFVQGFQNAPKELLLVSNHISLIFLELECINQMQHDNDAITAFTQEESWVLKQTLGIVKNDIALVYQECVKATKPGSSKSSRLSWAMFNRKMVDNALVQLQRTQSHLLLVWHIINMQRSIRVERENSNQNARILEALQTYHEELQRRSVKTQENSPTPTAQLVAESSTTFRHRYTFAMSKYWKNLFNADIYLISGDNAFQAAYDFYARIPLLAPSGSTALVLSCSLRRLLSLRPSISLLTGNINFVNIVPVESEIIDACKRGDVLKVHDLFLQKKAAPNDMTNEDRTLLFYAAQSGSTDIVQFLIKAGAPVRSKQLLAASWWRNPDMARVLLHNGASVEILGVNGYTAADYLFGSSRPPIPQTTFLEILACNSFSNFNAQDNDGWTVLHRAAGWGTPDDVKTLLRMKASTESRTYKLGWTPLIFALCYKNFENLCELCSSSTSADWRDQRDFRGWNLLHIAIGYGNLEAVPFLLEQGVDSDALSQATSRSVPAALRDKQVTPGDIARRCGKDAYRKWAEALASVGREVEVRPENIDWSLEDKASEFGVCECCVSWNAEGGDSDD